jgi:hypothetical protein
MLVRLRKYVLLALMLMVPFQGLAATLHALSCVEHDGQAAVASGHAHAGANHGASHHHHPDESTGGGGDHSAYQCCHHYTSAAAPKLGSGTDAELPPFQSSISLLETLFFPEQPQRPPRV